MSEEVQYIESLIGKFPSQAENLQRIFETRKNRLWHQFTELVTQYIHDPEVKQYNHFTTFYDVLLRDIATKLNPLSHAHIAVEIMKQINNPELQLEYLLSLPGFPSHKKDKKDMESNILLKTTVAELKVTLGNIDEASKSIDELESLLETIHSSDSTVYASFYKAKAQLLKSKGDVDEFYNTGLKYLSYAKMESVDKDEKSRLATDLSIAALVNEKTYNFRELLEKQILVALNNTPNEWLALIIDCFNSGNFNRWEELQNQYSTQMNSVPELIQNKNILSQKISILALIEYIFNQSGKDSTVSFEVVSKVSRIELSDVELLLMKANSVGLLKGKINQMLQHIVIDWVQPRALELEQVNKMKDRLAEWKLNVKSALELVEDHLTPELIS